MTKEVRLSIDERIPDESLLYTGGRWLPTNPKLHATQCPVRNVYFYHNALYAHVPDLTDAVNVNRHDRQLARLF